MHDYSRNVESYGYLPVWISLILRMLEHFVSCYVGRISGDVKLLLVQPVGHVIVLTAPTPEHVREAIDLDQRNGVIS